MSVLVNIDLFNSLGQLLGLSNAKNHGFWSRNNPLHLSHLCSVLYLSNTSNLQKGLGVRGGFWTLPMVWHGGAPKFFSRVKTKGTSQVLCCLLIWHRREHSGYGGCWPWNKLSPVQFFSVGFTRMKERRPIVTRKLLVLLRCTPSFLEGSQKGIFPDSIWDFFFQWSVLIATLSVTLLLVFGWEGEVILKHWYRVRSFASL